MEVNSKVEPLMLANFEVYQMLGETSKEMKEGRHKATGQKVQNLSIITDEVLQYLKGTPCINQNPECIKDFCLSLNKYRLTKAEKLQLLNLRPTTSVEICLIVEESEERLTEEQIDEVIQIIKQLPPGPGSNDREDEEIEDEEREVEQLPPEPGLESKDSEDEEIDENCVVKQLPPGPGSGPKDSEDEEVIEEKCEVKRLPTGSGSKDNENEEIKVECEVKQLPPGSGSGSKEHEEKKIEEECEDKSIPSRITNAKKFNYSLILVLYLTISFIVVYAVYFYFLSMHEFFGALTF